MKLPKIQCDTNQNSNIIVSLIIVLLIKLLNIKILNDIKLHMKTQ